MSEFWALEYMAKVAQMATPEQLANLSRLRLAQDIMYSGVEGAGQENAARESRRSMTGALIGAGGGTLLGGLAIGAIDGATDGFTPEHVGPGALVGGVAGGMLGLPAGVLLAGRGHQARSDAALDATLARLEPALGAFEQHPFAARAGSPSVDPEQWTANIVSGPLAHQRVKQVPMATYHSTPHVSIDPFVDYVAGRRPTIPAANEVLDLPGAKNTTGLFQVPNGH